MGDQKIPKLMGIFRVRRITYLGEQDGTAERDLKEQVSELLYRKSIIRRAYLARVNYGPTEPEVVALCLYPATGSDDRLLATEISKIFRSMFNESQHLDILFLKSHQEIELAKVCRPFLVRKAIN